MKKSLKYLNKYFCISQKWYNRCMMYGRPWWSSFLFLNLSKLCFFYNCHINLRELKCNKKCSLFCVNDLNNFVFAAFLYPFSHWLIYPTYTILLEPAGNFISYTITVMHKFSVEFDNASIITALIFSNKSAAFFPS